MTRVSVALAHVARVLLAVGMGLAGVAHLVNTSEFYGQLPPWVPARDAVIIVSGVVELGFAMALLLAPRRLRPIVGLVLAAFFVAVFPGNVYQWLAGNDAFGLDTDRARLLRLPFQPVLVVWALWCTGAWAWWRDRRPPQRHTVRAP